jgi:alkylation response protein AidB-like acyl-CoA dehydrogenase
MNLNYDTEYRLFRDEVREFLSLEWLAGAGMPHDSAAERSQAFRLRATEKGYLYRGIPREYGGSEQTPDPLKARIIAQEFAKAGAPRELSGAGTSRLIPTLLKWGTEVQKRIFIPAVLSGEHIWCQGYSEPEAGSDLASLRTRADLIDGEWVINGQKIWTSRAHYATHIFMLVRSEPDRPGRAGLSYLLVPLKQEGVDVRRLRQLTGDASFNEVFFTDAKAPRDWIVGERGAGWEVSRTTLKFERDQMGGPEEGLSLFNKIVGLAKRTTRNGGLAIDDPEVRQWLVALEGHVLSSYWTGQYQFTLGARGESAGVLDHVGKFLTMHVIGLEASRIAHELIGDDSLLLAEGRDSGKSLGNERWVNQILGSLAATMGGGTSNIQRNIIAERGLGLPRDL